MDKIGRLEVICGPMYSGKSEELQRRLRREKIAKKEVIVFKPKVDTRYDSEAIVSHNGVKMEAIPSTIDEMWDRAWECDVIGIDEIQFYEDEVIDQVEMFVAGGKKVIISGLDMDFRRAPFGVMPYFLSVAEQVDKLYAVCHVCGHEAYFTQRLHDGQPANFEEDTVEIGGLESYEARCRLCFQEG